MNVAAALLITLLAPTAAFAATESVTRVDYALNVYAPKLPMVTHTQLEIAADLRQDILRQSNEALEQQVEQQQRQFAQSDETVISRASSQSDRQKSRNTAL
ncbi:hypothetical protein [Ferrimonas sp. SCSIO 43195]|uniref:hypothetical protein n=1 Tax=Ferrimonas sp. SCSIO 43195 TaxID=2822844 RepID=UPI002075787D|nr:hypothetical protein [Ferrimonas sp. SCSIO 43195]USD38250.1 hypothetical protein J8Z22_03605 [Ferrimonas sp. SCSIO 43195]